MGLVVSQVAVSLLLLIGAGLVTRSLDAARSRPGIRRHQRDLVENRCLVERLRRDPRARVFRAAAGPLARRPGHGISDVGKKPAADDGRSRGATGDDRRLHPRRDEDLTFLSNIVAPDYFRTLSIRLVAGREFESRDDAAAMPVAIVNETLARRFWGGGAEAVGKRVRVASDEWRTVIGVARDVKYSRVTEAPRPYVYLPFLQTYQAGHDAPRARLRRRGAVDRTPADACPGARSRPADVRDQIAQRSGSGDADDPGNGRRRPVHLRRRGHGAGGDGHLRTGVVHGQAEHARDRHPDGARRAKRRRRVALSAARAAPGRDRRHRRDRRRAGL